MSSPPAYCCEASEVLLLGRDEKLLSYREKVLRRAGFATVILHWTERLDTAALPAAKVVVLGHTLLKEERQQVISSLRKLQPTPRVIALDAQHISVDESQSYDAIVGNLAGPALLIEQVRKQLINNPARPG